MSYTDRRRLEHSTANRSHLAIRIVRFVAGAAIALSGGGVVNDGGYTRGSQPNANLRVIIIGLTMIAAGVSVAVYPFSKYRNRNWF